MRANRSVTTAVPSHFAVSTVLPILTFFHYSNSRMRRAFECHGKWPIGGFARPISFERERWANLLWDFRYPISTIDTVRIYR